MASAPPTARIDSIDKAFTLGWGGAVFKTITPDDLEMIEASQRYASWRHGSKVCGFENIELLSHLTIQEWLDGIKYLKQKHPTKVQIASIMAPVIKEEWQKLVKTFNHSEIDAFELNFSCPDDIKNKAIPNLSAHEKLPKTKQVYPHIDNDICVKCGKCVTICYESEYSALSMEDGIIKVDKNRCVGCSLCSHVCPRTAIKLR